MSKRPIRKARRKARRAKVKTEIDSWREAINEVLMDLDKRMTALEETVAAVITAK
jgi:hypothetical protein